MDSTLKAVQQRLIDLGYDLGPAGADGISGRFTTSAVAKFQADKGLPIKWPGTIGPITIAALNLDAKEVHVTPPWILEGLRKKGLHEKTNNKELRAYLASDGHALGDPAKLPWCGDFMETIIALTLPREPMVVNPYWAANWLKFGVPVQRDEYYLGAIGVKARPGGNHVFTLVGHDKTAVHALGGNQSNSISIVKIRKSDITAMRFPATYQFPTEQMSMTTFTGSYSTKED
ncbi:peptidoglycan-binding protein [Rhizobium sp. SSA_523]|uniref:NlpC/P60 family protein n=1 Tax=Rhizobium sp. SSA_523 TaxID=2952477 RepID=UPI002091553E|nr:peptidoglycan-binding protein [Rhizobium sp. SSA_523]MCO5730065.1 peptidoglycan-binding protein [Rhizobium sp. SSA_523]WKC25131.1 peptidoglycan-binding protein [Rhizobium sp. SSA_523]